MSKIMGGMIVTPANQVTPNTNAKTVESGIQDKNERVPKIIGVTVGTPTSPAKMKEELKPVTSVNGVEADENGNVDVTGGINFETDNTLILKDGILSVNTTDDMEKDNTLPITSAGVYATVGNIEALLKTI